MRRNKKGFTLAELLIVMAIIAVLAAIAIPNFARQLESARETSDLNAIRAAYSEAMTVFMTKYSANGATDVTVYKQIAFDQKQNGWQYANVLGKADSGGSMPWDYANDNGGDTSNTVGTVYAAFEFYTYQAAGGEYITECYMDTLKTAPTGGTIEKLPEAA